MKIMGIPLRHLGLTTAVVILIAFILFVVNQTAQFVNMVSTFNPTAGQIVLVGLLLVYAVVVGVPLVIFVRLPRAIRPPADESSPEFPEYLEEVRSRLASNRNLVGASISKGDRAGIEAALKVLNEKADMILKTTASTVFVSTAISQSGRLDSIMVLLAQSRMVWQVAHVYNQRPSLRELISLYANVAATTFIATEVEDLDVSEQVGPVVGAVLGSSLVGAIPGVSVVATVLTNSIVEGSANAFMTLRVGAITKQYCASLTTPNRALVRRFASVEAASMLGSIVLESGGVVSKAILDAASKAGAGMFSPLTDATRDALTTVSNTLSDAAKKAGQEVGKPLARGGHTARKLLGRRTQDVPRQ